MGLRLLKQRGDMSVVKYIFRACLVLLPMLQLVSTEPLPAGFSTASQRMHVEIDGIDFGTFDRVKNIEHLAANDLGTTTKITLNRDFVTDRSLYSWTTAAMQSHLGPKDIHLVMLDNDGDEVERYVLKYCQPLSWSVEAANPSIGGYHERVEFAVQSIESPDAY